MQQTLQCISPVDGSIHAERPVAADKELERAFAAARHAQYEWSRVPVSERARYCTHAVDAMLAMADEIEPELAWQMGRPVSFAGSELKGFEEHTPGRRSSLVSDSRKPSTRPGCPTACSETS